MPAGIRATVRFPEASVCPIGAFAVESDATVETVAHSVATESQSAMTEFTIASDADVPAEFEAIISYGARTRYRMPHEGVDCPCTCLGEFGCPTERYLVEDRALTVVFNAADFDRLRTIVRTLRDRFPEVDIRRFVRSPAETDPADSVFVDRSRLTDRQRETLETAYEMGYFEHPRSANAGEVADALDIAPSTFAEHLAAAQSKLLGDVFERRS